MVFHSVQLIPTSQQVQMTIDLWFKGRRLDQHNNARTYAQLILLAQLSTSTCWIQELLTIAGFGPKITMFLTILTKLIAGSNKTRIWLKNGFQTISYSMLKKRRWKKPRMLREGQSLLR